MKVRTVVVAALATAVLSSAAYADRYDPNVMKNQAFAGLVSLFAAPVALLVVPSVNQYAKSWPGPKKGGGKKGR